MCWSDSRGTGNRSRLRQHRPACRDDAAFTLLELLVVMAVLSILSALLIPVVQKAWAAAQERACAAHLRSWGQAFILCASDHEGYLPHTDGPERVDTSGHPGQPHEHCYVDMLPPYLGERPWCDYPEGEKPTAGIWQCPRARPLPDGAYSYQPSHDGYFSYAMNSYVEHDFDYGLPWGVEKQPSFLSLSKCAAPAKTILMFEQTLDPSQGNDQRGSLDTAGHFPAEDARAATERHSHTLGGLGGNVLYIDSHVNWRNDLWDKTLKTGRQPKRGDLTWFPYVY